MTYIKIEHVETKIDQVESFQLTYIIREAVHVSV